MHEVQTMTQTAIVLPYEWEMVRLLILGRMRYLSSVDRHDDDPEIEKMARHMVLKYSHSQFETYLPPPPSAALAQIVAFSIHVKEEVQRWGRECVELEAQNIDDLENVF